MFHRTRWRWQWVMTIMALQNRRYSYIAFINPSYQVLIYWKFRCEEKIRSCILCLTESRYVNPFQHLNWIGKYMVELSNYLVQIDSTSASPLFESFSSVPQVIYLFIYIYIWKVYVDNNLPIPYNNHPEDIYARSPLHHVNRKIYPKNQRTSWWRKVGDLSSMPINIFF